MQFRRASWPRLSPAMSQVVRTRRIRYSECKRAAFKEKQDLSLTADVISPYQLNIAERRALTMCAPGAQVCE